MKETNVKRVWARVGMTYVLPEDEYKKLIEAAKKNDKENVRRIVNYSATSYRASCFNHYCLANTKLYC